MSKNRGWRYSRVEHNPREKAFADAWEKENDTDRNVIYGNGILQDLFIQEDDRMNRNCIRRISDADRMVVATIVQWLGSNVGWSFLQGALNDCGFEIVKIEPKGKGV